MWIQFWQNVWCEELLLPHLLPANHFLEAMLVWLIWFLRPLSSFHNRNIYKCGKNQHREWRKQRFNQGGPVSSVEVWRGGWSLHLDPINQQGKPVLIDPSFPSSEYSPGLSEHQLTQRLETLEYWRKCICGFTHSRTQHLSQVLLKNKSSKCLLWMAKLSSMISFPGLELGSRISLHGSASSSEATTHSSQSLVHCPGNISFSQPDHSIPLTLNH